MADQKLKLNPSLAWSLASVALIALMLFYTLPSVMAAAFSSNPDELQVATTLEGHLETHREALTLYQDRFNGRSVFFKPLKTPTRTKPRPTHKAPEPIVDQNPTPPKEDPIPKQYTGPSVMAILGDEVWFVNPQRNSSPLRIRLGEEQSGIKILEVNAPWSVKVGYQRGEFKVSLFEVKEFLADASEAPAATKVDVPQGLIESSKPEREQDSDQDSNVRSDKNQSGVEQDPDLAPKSDSPDADNKETQAKTPGNRGPDEQKDPR
ncbi:MAG: hypothetical protein O7G85_11170 [Planctomycetota bacterium]|nr:hypothetical protein [Planctomycetota bacterium]